MILIPLTSSRSQVSESGDEALTIGFLSAHHNLLDILSISWAHISIVGLGRVRGILGVILPVARSLAGGPWVLPPLAVEGGVGQFVVGLRPSQIQKFQDHTPAAIFNVEVATGHGLFASAQKARCISSWRKCPYPSVSPVPLSTTVSAPLVQIKKIHWEVEL